MIITCPNCGTSYEISPGSLGAAGKPVRCSACGHQWHQMPAIAPPPQAAYPPPQTAYPPPPHPHAPADAGYAPPGAYPPPPPPRPAEEPPAPPPAPPPSATPPPPAPPPEPSVDSDFADLGDDETTFENLNSREPAEAEGFDFSEDDDDMMGGAAEPGGPEIDDSDPEPLTSLADDIDDGPPPTFHDDPDALPDPEPIPQVFTGEAPKSGRREGGWLRMVLIGLALLVVAAGMGAYLFRDAVVGMWPGAESLYASLGMQEPLGSGLDVIDTRTEFSTEGDGDTMVVRGVVVNTTDMPRPVPNLKIVLLDAEDSPVQTIVVEPSRPEVEPAGRQRFRAVVRNMAPTARRMEVQFTEDPATE